MIESAAHERTAYEAPSMDVIGTLHELTLLDKGDFAADGIIYNNNPIGEPSP